MRWVRFEREGETAFGMLAGEAEGAEVQAVQGTPWGEHSPAGGPFALDSVRLLPPVIPPTFYAAGLNYVDHIKSQAASRGEEPKIPPKPDIGYRAVNALAAHGEDIVVPADAGQRVHYEGELVAVVGRQARHLSEDNALSCIFGYTIGNDVSERDWQAEDRTMWRSKNSDTWKPMGPWIETDLDLDAARTIVKINGETTIDFPTNNMLYGIATYIAAMTRYLTLVPGDIIWMGTEGTSPNMTDGDLCEIEITGIGTLRNTFRREKG